VDLFDSPGIGRPETVAGSGDDNACEKIEVKKPTAKRDEPKAKRESSERTKVDAAPPKPRRRDKLYVIRRVVGRSKRGAIWAM
jgi:hypothetical protein